MPPLLRTSLGLLALVAGAVGAKSVHDRTGWLTLPLFTLLASMAVGLLLRGHRRLRTWRPPMEILLSVGMILLGVQFDRAVLARFGWPDVLALLLHWGIVSALFVLACRLRLLGSRPAGLLAVGLGGAGLSAVIAASAGDPQTRRELVFTTSSLTLLCGAIGFAAMPALARAFEMDAPTLAAWAGIAMPTTAEAALIGAGHSPEALQIVGAYRFVVNVLQWIPIVAYLRCFGPQQAEVGSIVRRTVRGTVRRIPAFVWGLAFFGAFGLCGGFCGREQQVLGHVTNWAFLSALVGLGLVIRPGALLGEGWRVALVATLIWLLAAAILPLWLPWLRPGGAGVDPGRIPPMASSADRIRRVLSDGAAPPAARPAEPRLRAVIGPAEKPTVPEPPTLDEGLRKRLEALGVGLATDRALEDRRRLPGREPDEPPAMPLRPGVRLEPPAEDFLWASLPDAGSREAPQPLEELVGADERETPHGTFLQVERRFGLTQDHGRHRLDEATTHPVPLRPHERGPGATKVMPATDAAFIDTETTGLAGGTGTVAFLIGAGWIEDDVFVLRQYFMRDYPDEAAVLHALEEDLGERPLVSFNGRSFDWPLLTTRWQMHRTKPTPRAHFDLLTAARRLWSSTLHSHSLATLERHVLGLERGEDLPGYLIPTAWFDYVRSGWAGTIAQAFRHNEIDVVSMLTLFARVGAILDEPIARVDAPADRLGTARLLLDLGDPQKARSCLEAGLPDAAPAEGRGIHRLLGHLCRRNREWDAALAHWLQVAESDEFDAEAYEQVAKLHEHRLGDPQTALRWTAAALEQLVEGTRLYEDFAHRAARLERKIARADR